MGRQRLRRHEQVEELVEHVDLVVLVQDLEVLQERGPRQRYPPSQV